MSRLTIWRYTFALARPGTDYDGETFDVEATSERAAEAIAFHRRGACRLVGICKTRNVASAPTEETAVGRVALQRFAS